MRDGYLVAVTTDIRNHLKFPNKCAYCLAPMPLEHISIKHDQLKACALRVPYCETHAKIIRYMKLVQYGSFAFALLIAVVLGKYLHDNRVFTPFNYWVAGFVGFVVFFIVFGVLVVVSQRYFKAQGFLDEVGAVAIVQVYRDGFVLLFDNRAFGTEFSQLNPVMPIETQKSP